MPRTPTQLVTPAVNTTPLRLGLEPDVAADGLVRAAHAALLTALQHGAFPLARIQQLCPAVQGSLFSVIVDYQARIVRPQRSHDPLT